MQSIFVNVISYLQLCSAKLPGYWVIIEANSMMIGGFAAPMTMLLTLFFVEHGMSSIVCLI